MSLARRNRKHESEYKKEAHKYLAEGKKVRLGNLWREMKDKELEAGVKPTVKRNAKRKMRISIFLRVSITILVFGAFYYYSISRHSENGFMELTAFYLLYGFAFSVLSGFFLKFLTGKGYSFSIMFYHIFYTVATAVGAFSALYVPTLLILFIAQKPVEWLSVAFIIGLIVFPIAYSISAFLLFAKEKNMTPKEYLLYLLDFERRRNEKARNLEEVKGLDEFYNRFDAVSENYESKVSRKFTEEEILN